MHDVFDGVAVERVGRGGVGKDVAEDVGSGPGAVLFIARGHVAGAHDAAGKMGLAAVAGAIAELGGALQTLGGGEVEIGLELACLLAGAIAETGVHGRRIHNLVRVENGFWVPGLLEGAEERVVAAADHAFEKLAAQASVAVFAAEGATVFLDEGGDVLGDLPEEAVAAFGLEVDDGAEVDFTAASVGVVHAFELIAFLEELVEAGDVFGQVLHVDGGVFHDGHGLGVAGNVGEEAESGLAQIPHAIGVGVGDNGEVVAVSGGFDGIGYGLRFGDGVAFAVSSHFDDEQGSGIALQEEAIGFVGAVAFGAVEDVAVHELAAVGGVLDGDEIGLQRFVDSLEMGAKENVVGGREIEDANGDFGSEKEGAFGTGDELAEVEGFLGRGIEWGGVHEQIERVAGIASRDGGFGKFGGDFCSILRIGERVANVSVDLGLEAVGGTVAFGLECFRREVLESDFAAVREKAFGGDKVLAGAAVDNRVGATGIVAQHAAEHGPVLGGGLGPEEFAVGSEVSVELVAYHARLDAGPAFGCVDLEDLSEVLGYVDDDALADDLTGERSARRARNERGAVVAGEVDESADVLACAGNGNG